MGVRRFALGLMSGTSMDGVDAALCEFMDERLIRVVSTHHCGYPPALRERLLALQREPNDISLSDWAELDNAVARIFAETALPLCQQGSVTIIGSHGQTVFHDPDTARSSLQLGNPSLIAAETGTPVVADFRRADIALGGQGAPLVPAFHFAQFARAGESCAVVNIGGIANVTLLTGLDPGAVRGWDTGPGNGLMDEWIQQHRGLPFDAGGEWAMTGRVDAGMLDALMADPYFNRLPPKSSGRDYFNLAWLRQHFPALDQCPIEDVQRTSCELTARTVCAALTRQESPPAVVLLCGGGARNALLVQRIKELLGAGIRVESTAARGLDEMVVEAAAFAWLAICRILERPGSLPEVTGARCAAVLGGLYL